MNYEKKFNLALGKCEKLLGCMKWPECLGGRFIDSAFLVLTGSGVVKKRDGLSSSGSFVKSTKATGDYKIIIKFSICIITINIIEYVCTFKTWTSSSSLDA